MSLSSVYLWLKTLVFWNDSFQLVFTLKTTCLLKIPALKIFAFLDKGIISVTNGLVLIYYVWRKTFQNILSMSLYLARRCSALSISNWQLSALDFAYYHAWTYDYSQAAFVHTNTSHSLSLSVIRPLNQALAMTKQSSRRSMYSARNTGPTGKGTGIAMDRHGWEVHQSRYNNHKMTVVMV